MAKPLIAISGSNGQLGNELKVLHASFAGSFDFIFAGRELLDLSSTDSITDFFNSHHPDFFINCAAYTAVDKAESDQLAAYRINAEAMGQIAQHCHRTGCVLIQVSTDYVFNGRGERPYRPGDATDPVNYYGYTKWLGEKLSLENNPRTIIIRTSWVYSSFGHNFVKTMLRLMKERDEISVVEDQLGCPTYAADLAAAIMHVIRTLQQGAQHFGIYHYSNQGAISWYTFAVAIRDLAGYSCKVHPISTEAYPTPAKRPAYSVMDLTRIEEDYGVPFMEWRKSLEVCLGLLGPDV
jgi:dTDP-4-dehydrorhamnose reductase